MTMGFSLGLGLRGPFFGPGSVDETIYYVDALTGDDTNGGLAFDDALATLSAGITAASADGGIMSLAAGSEWDEQGNLPSANFSIRSHGAGAMPYIDAAGPVTETWYQPDAVTYPNVWAIDVTHGWASAGQSRLVVWEDGVQLAKVADLAALDATPGAGIFNDDLFGTTVGTTYIHASDSGNPNSNGSFYEVCRRQWAIKGAFTATGTHRVTGPVKVGRQAHNDGSITLGKNSTMRQVYAVDGHKHNALQESGTCTQSVFRTALDMGAYLHVFYSDTPAGFTGTYSNSGFIWKDDGSISTQTLGVYCHGTSGQYASLTVDQNWFVGLLSGVQAAAVATNITGNHFIDCAATGLGAGTVTFQHNTGNLNWGATRRTLLEAGFVTNLDCSQNAFYMQAAGSSGSTRPIYRLTGIYNDQLSFTNNTFIYDVDYAPQIISRDATSSVGDVTFRDNVVVMNHSGGVGGHVYIWIGSGTYDGDYNIFWNGDGGTNPVFSIGSNDVYTFAQWQALGYDQNSILIDSSTITLDDLFVGGTAGLAAGDFRLRTDTGLTFGDGTPIHERAGVREHRNWNTGGTVSTAPTNFPSVPTSDTECALYVMDPAGWDFYPGAAATDIASTATVAGATQTAIWDYNNAYQDVSGTVPATTLAGYVEDVGDGNWPLSAGLDARRPAWSNGLATFDGTSHFMIAETGSGLIDIRSEGTLAFTGWAGSANTYLFGWSNGNVENLVTSSGNWWLKGGNSGIGDVTTEHTFVFTWSGGTAEMYVDGVLAASFGYTQFSSTAAGFAVGGRSTGTGFGLGQPRVRGIVSAFDARVTSAQALDISRALVRQ